MLSQVYGLFPFESIERRLEMRDSYNPMQDKEFASVVALLEQGSDRLVALAEGRDRNVPQDQLYRRSRDLEIVKGGMMANQITQQTQEAAKRVAFARRQAEEWRKLGDRAMHCPSSVERALPYIERGEVPAGLFVTDFTAAATASDVLGLFKYEKRQAAGSPDYDK
ncbi:MAG: hypothetical protein U9R11_02480 [Chloroflexota bacterium]|nr:hypothetical protein [Chloroflexota bacterium]